MGRWVAGWEVGGGMNTAARRVAGRELPPSPERLLT